MNKLKSRNKICFQNNKNIHSNLKLSKLKKKKWNLFKKRIKYKNEIKPEKKDKFYQKRLFEKQQLKFFYGCLPDYQLKNIYQKLKRKKKNISIFKNLMSILESRLDINITRLRLAKSIFESKQLINHNKILVNDKIVNKPNFLLKKGDIIKIK
jgi:ribosomal protein S4